VERDSGEGGKDMECMMMGLSRRYFMRCVYLWRGKMNDLGVGGIGSGDWNSLIGHSVNPLTSYI